MVAGLYRWPVWVSTTRESPGLPRESHFTPPRNIEPAPSTAAAGAHADRLRPPRPVQAPVPAGPGRRGHPCLIAGLAAGWAIMPTWPSDREAVWIGHLR